MIRKKTSDKSNSNFRQQESAMKELDKNVETAEQRNISQTKNVIESPQQETDQGKLQKESFKQSQHSNQEFQQQESTVQVVDRKYETVEQKQYSQTASTIESPKQETDQGKLQKESFKQFQHTNQEFQQQESTVQVVDRNYETAEQKQYSQTASTIESPKQETDQGKLQKESFKQFQHTNQEFQQQESAVQVVDRNYETAEQKQFSQTINTIDSPQQEIDQGKLQKQSSKLFEHTTQEFHQPESTVKVLNKTIETAEQKQYTQTTSTIDSPQQETDQGKLQKHSSKLSEHINQEFHQPESTVKVLNKTIETAEQKQFSQTTSTIESPQQETNQGKLQKQFSKLSQHTSHEFHQPENTAKVQNKTFETVEQKQFSQTASVIESPKQDTSQGKLQKQSSKLLEHSTQELKQPESTVKVLNKKQVLQTIDAIESPPEKRQGKLQKQSSKLSQHIKQEFQPHESAVQKVDRKVETVEQKQVSQTKSAIEIPQQETNQGKLQKQSSKQSQHVNQKIRKQDLIKDVKQPETLKSSQQKQLGQTENSLLKDGEKNPSKLSTENSKARTGMRFVGKLSKSSLIATKDSIKDGIKKYQKSLEQEDEGVKIGSQGITQGYRVTRTLAKKGLVLTKNGFQKLKKMKDSRKSRKPNKKTNVKKLRKSRQEKLYIKKIDKGKIERFQKLKGLDKKASVKKLTKAKELTKATTKKITKATAKKLTKVTTNIAGSSALKYQEQLEKGDEGVKLASQSATKIARATNKLVKNRIKANAKLGKMGKQKGKLVPFSKDKKLKVESRTLLKKKAVKKKMYYGSFRDKNKVKTLTSIASNVKNQVANLIKSLGKFNLQNVKKLIGTKVAAILGGGLASAVPLLLIGMICLLIAGAFGAGSSSQEQVSGNIGASKNLSPEVEKWRGLVEKEAAAQGMQDFVNLLLAIIQIESGGTGTPDIMQSSESAGYGRPNVFQTEEESVRQGVKHLKECLLALKAFNRGYENNIKALAQAYNYGNYFATWLGKRGGEYNLEVAEEYSRTVVAPSLGNTTGITTSYVNETSLRVGKPYRYVDGGNFHYGELISEYIGGPGANISGDFKIVLAEIEKYQGWPYKWGGKNPTQGFDCSGLTSWGLKQIGIDLPSYALSQYELTEPIDPSQAQPGDLIFFKGTYQSPDHISHVGFYIDENTMYDSEDAGIGYHSWKTPYWQKHFAGIHRVKR
ncbi:lysozyme family protein [Bacillus thuringiensis]|uniref:lysozyme family protein n=1 Tax=Bacillus thuringiensis TaxID=1428 RepID=UPI0020753FDE|nr:lysozyme family protein [Bacillus thuringiensis]